MCKKLEKLALTCLLKPGTPAKLICRHFKATRSICLIPERDTEVYNEHFGLKTIPLDVLAIHLRKFCNEAKPKDSLSRRDKLPPIKAEPYHMNTFKKTCDEHYIVTKTGAPRATQHKSIINSKDLRKNL